MNGRTLVVGMGNDYRCDDAVGPVVARRVASRLGNIDRHDIDVLGGVADPLDLLGRWEGAALVVVVDAVRSDAPAGTVSVVELSDLAPTPGGTSTHGIGVVTALRLARSLGQAPERVVLVAIAGADFGRGDGLGPAVADAVPGAVEHVVALVTAARVTDLDHGWTESSPAR